MPSSKVVRGIALVGGLFLVVFGLWAFFSPKSFFDTVATYPPYNEHLIHDIGAFQIGIGASLLVALTWTDALLVALFGAALGSVVHEISHIIDRDLGGKDTDPISIGAVALVLVVATIMRKRELKT